VSSPVTRLCLSEHDLLTSGDALSEAERLVIEEALAAGIHEGPRLFSNQTAPFVLTRTENGCSVQIDYLIGADWLVPGRAYVHVIPKVDRALARRYAETVDREPLDEPDVETTGDFQRGRASDGRDNRTEPGEQVHYLRMLMTIARDSVFDDYFENNLFYINNAAPPLPLPSDGDQLTPLLVVRFIQVLRRLVSKGLRKSYYSVTRNLTNRVKGKVLVSQHIKENVLKSRLTSVLCRYDAFGENTLENQFLKQCLRFARRYIETHGKLFGEMLGDLRHVMRLVSPAFERVDELRDVTLLKHTTHHPFYGEYKEAIRVGKLLLQRFGYAVNAIDSGERVMTPPFWINMPALFEMYVCAMMRAHNPELLRAIHYQFPAPGNRLDILVGCDRCKAVIDTKYKLVPPDRRTYRDFHQDVRQVAGYARLKKVRRELGIPDGADDTVDCLIVYPDVEKGIDDFSVDAIWKEKREVAPYHRVWLLGVKIPLRTSGMA
jgi:5-methylcytosine-specific restriction enzyme subunit McrC